MATTFHDYDGDEGTGANSAEYAFTFPSFKQEEVKVEVDNEVKTVTTHYTIINYSTSSGGKVRFTTNNIPTLSTQKVRVYRETDVDTAKAEFTAGASLKANELNNNITQILRGIQDRSSALGIQTHDIRDAAITTDKIKDDNVTLAKLGSGALPTDITVASANIVNGTIVNDDVNASAAIAGTKVTPAFGSQNLSTSGTAATGALTVTGNIGVSGTVDGRDVAADGTKLDGIEAGATADQTAAEIRTLTEAATDSNVFTDADHSKLNAIEAGATADQTATEIRTLVESASDSNVFTDADHSKLNAIESGATQDQTASEIKTLFESSKLTNAHITDGTLDGRYYTETELNPSASAGNNVLDARYYTETELNAGQLDNRYYTETEAEGLFLRQDSSETIASGATWSGTDSKVATTAAIDARIIDLVDDVGGFVPIASETNFPTANPDVNNGAGTLVSIKAIGSTRTPNSGTVTIANGSGSNTVTITGCGSTVLTAGFGVIVETTTTLHTYAFHRLVPKATEVTTVAANATNIAAAGANVTNIDNFANRYQISTSAPTARPGSGSLANGDLWFDSSSNKVMMVYDGSSGDGYSPITPNQSDLTNINIVAGQLTYTEDLGNITDAVNTGSGNNSVNTVATDITNVNTVAGAISNVNAVANNATNINNVAADATDIGAVAAKATEIGRLGTADAVADLALLGTADAVADMNTLATSANVTAMDNCSDDIANINTVSGSIGNVNTTAGSIANVNTTATNITNVNTVAGVSANVTTVAGISANVTTVAGNSSNVTTVANNITGVNSFADRYRVASSAPTSSLDEGDLYFDTTQDELRIYNGSAWQGGVTATGNLLLRSGGQMTGNITFSGSQTVDGRDLSADGSKLDGIEANATADQTASEIVSLISGQTIAPNVITTTNLTLDFGTI